MKEKIENLLKFVYGEETFNQISSGFETLLEKEGLNLKAPSNSISKELPVDETDAIVITYGDQFHEKPLSPLKVLKKFMDKHLSGSVSGVHILPFSPYSSDDGFSVIDYRKVDPDLGSWEDIEKIASSYRLMADLVLNHCSVRSEWFKKYLEWDEKYRDYFISVEKGTDLSSVFRPRALPLLTPFNTADGEKLVWTTFSADQVDLNYANPEVLMEMISILFFYIQRGIQIIRLDAVAFLWKETGHTCLHHEKTHAVVKIFREIVRNYAPWVVIITETNVPHKENLSYFGDGTDEAQLVYQFALPPLTLDAYIREDASHLRDWAAESLDKPSKSVSFFNFHASHDGIGVLPAKGILSDSEIENLLETVKSRGGFISYKATKEGDIPYEMNVNYFSAISGDEPDIETAVAKFLSSQSIILAMTGMPGIYIHSLLGSLNYREGVALTGMNRSINREKLDYSRIEKELSDPESARSMVLEGYKRMLNARKIEKAFSPGGKQIVLESSGPVLAVLRVSPEGEEKVLCLNNISSRIVKSFPGWDFFDNHTDFKFYDIIKKKTSKSVLIADDDRHSGKSGGAPMLTLQPWEVVWLK